MKIKFDSEKLKKAAILKAWYIADISKESGLGRATAGLVMEGIGTPKAIKQVADCLGVPMEELLSDLVVNN